MSFQYTIFFGSRDSKEIQRKSTERFVRPDDVVIKITHSGLCYTDIHGREMGICLGHEGVGIVERAGEDVRNLKVGDRVGFAVVRDTCGHCLECLQGEDMYCDSLDAYTHPAGSTNLGSIASHAIIRETFVFRIPDVIENLYAGPLMCAGATVFEPLYRHGVRPADRVGVVGLGGVGHMAVQFASKMGCEVVVFSSTDDKREEAYKLGAHEFHATKGKDKLEGVKPIKHLLVSASFLPDWNLLIPILSPRPSIYLLTVSAGTVDIPVLPLLTKGIRVQGILVAPRSLYYPMLAFAAANNILPMVKTFPMTEEGIEQAFEELEAGTLRYRAVLVAQD